MRTSAALGYTLIGLIAWFANWHAITWVCVAIVMFVISTAILGRKSLTERRRS